MPKQKNDVEEKGEPVELKSWFVPALGATVKAATCEEAAVIADKILAERVAEKARAEE